MHHAACLAYAYLHKPQHSTVFYTSMDSTPERNTGAGNHKGYVHKFEAVHACRKVRIGNVQCMSSACVAKRWAMYEPRP